MEAHQDCCMKFLDVHITGPRNKQTQKQFLGDQNIFWRTNWLSQNCLSYCKVGLHQQLFFSKRLFLALISIQAPKKSFLFPIFRMHPLSANLKFARTDYSDATKSTSKRAALPKSWVFYSL